MIEQALVNTVPWPSRRSLPGSSSYVPGAIQDLLVAKNESDAETAYWQLDNRVVVQGQLFEAAVGVVGPLIIALIHVLPPFVRIRVVDLLVEIALGKPDASELEAGNPQLGEECRRELRNGLWVFYGLLDDEVARVRIGALDVLDAVELERERLESVARALRDSDSDPAVVARAGELMSL